MFQIYFLKVTVSKPNRYVILVKNQSETKRTDISDLWTTNPHFDNISINDFSDLEIKLCEAGLDKKIRILGKAEVKKTQLNMNSPILFEGEVRLQQQVEGKTVCVGLMNIRIQTTKQEEQEKLIQEGVNQQDDNYELDEQRIEEEQQEELQANDELRIEVHCGFNFYLGSEFFVQAEWGSSNSFKTRSIKDKINPVWAEGGRLQGHISKAIIIKVRDTKNNILESFKFQLSSLRILFPYHIKLVFKEEYMGAVPELYLSLIRESNAKHSIMEMPLKFGLRNIGEAIRNGTYLMITLNPKPFIPMFMPLERSKYVNMQQTNDYLVKRTLGQEERVDLIGLSNSTQKGLSIFKSYLNRKIYMFLIYINDFKSCFILQSLEGFQQLETKNDFQLNLRKIYYHGQTFTLKKLLEFFNPNNLPVETQGKSAAERWKLLTSNYILRNKLVNKSIKHIGELKQAIENKGKQLVEFKKILNQIKNINFGLVGKEKLMNSLKNRSKTNKMFVKEIESGALIGSLYEKQSILEGQKRINSELSLRMETLTEVQENQEDLDKDITKNAAKLLRQQEEIRKMRQMQQSIKRQRLIIGQLQKIFERGQMEKRVNKALEEQGEKLEKMRGKKQEELRNVYKIIKENNQTKGNLAVKVKHAEEMLIKLNQQYARLSGLL